MISSIDQQPSRIASFYSHSGRRRLSLDLGILLALVLITHIPLLGIAEPDSALFSTGARQWLHGGPHSVGIYSAGSCALYYAVVTALVHLFHLDARSCPELMSILSLIAGSGIIVLGYLIGLRLTGAGSIFRAMLLFLVSPGFWWVTVEPHPQAVSLAFSMAGIWAFVCYLERRISWLLIGSAVSFGIAMAVKIDAVFMLPALLAVTMWVDPTWRSALKAMLIGAGATVLAMALARLSLGDAAGSVTGGQQALRTFWRIPTMIDLVRDGAPAIFGIGIVSAVFVSVGLVIGFLRDAERKRWLAVLGLWSLPGYLFWLCIAGNNIRHVMAFGIPLFWFAAKYLDSRYVAACLALTLIVPGNSNVFMYPSPNVPASARLFGRKQLYLHSVANDLSKQSSCFVGSYTSDYLVAILLDQGGHIDSQESRTDASAAVVTMPNGVNITFKRISRTQKAVDLGSCKSLEYDQDGRKVHPFGGEWRIPII